MMEEKSTDYWYAFQTDATTFGFFLAYPNEESLDLHRKGAAAQAITEAIGPHIESFLRTRLSIIAYKIDG
jgi:quinol monooxygenase YgiN